MVRKIDTKFEGKFPYAFKNDMKNLTNFHRMKMRQQMQYGNFILPWK